MIDQSNQVREFMRVFGQELPDRPTIPRPETRELRLDLIYEESWELFGSTENTEALKEVCDILYVALGSGAAYGFSPEQIARGFAEVHRSNMSKLWSSTEVFLNNQSLLSQNASVTDTKLGSYIVKNSEGKVIKSPSYSPADLKGIVEE